MKGKTKTRGLLPQYALEFLLQAWPLKDVFLYDPPDWPGTPPESFPVLGADGLARRMAESLDAASFFDVLADNCTTEDTRQLFRGESGKALTKIAGQVIVWLAAQASKGECLEAYRAQKNLFDIARIACGELKAGWVAGWPVAVEAARRSETVPGFVSRHPVTNLEWQVLLSKIGQGEAVPGVVRQRGRKAKSKFVLDSPAQQLVSCLRDYIISCQNAFSCFEQELKLQVILPAGGLLAMDSGNCRVDEMRRLPPLTADTWREWHRVAWGIVLDHTGGEPGNHPAFQRPPLCNLRNPIVKVMAEAWKKRVSV